MFSPYYASRRRHGPADPENHVAINVALYGAAGHRWAMTERGRSGLSRDARRLRIGPSQLSWQDDGALTIDVAEWTVPLPRHLTGRITVRPTALGTEAFAIDGDGRHIWHPIAPHARVAVDMESHGAGWSGAGYIDHNRGMEPLEAAFRTWSWSRTIERGRTRVFYDTVTQDGRARSLHLAFTDSGDARRIEAPALSRFGHTLWRLPREGRSESKTGPRLVSVWEDGPFYARTLIEQRIGGVDVTAVHETLSLERFRQPIVQAMLPFRMPRRG